jgi:RecA/RadA recombinase
MISLDKIVKSVKKELDLRTLTIGTDYEDPVDFVSSGNLALDWCLGGTGFAFKFVVQLLGESKSGKTSLMLKTAGEAQKKYNAYVIWADREVAFVRSFAEKLGVNMDRLILAEAHDIRTPNDMYKFFITVHEALRKEDADAYIVMCLDSLAAFSSSQDGEDMGRKAKQHHEGFRDLMPLLDKKTLLLFANHVTYRVGIVFGKQTTHTGGTAPKYYSHYILELEGGKVIKDDNNVVIGQNIEAEVVKTRLGPAHRGCLIPFYYENGFQWYGGFMRMLVYKGIMRPSNKAEFKSGKPTHYVHLDTDKKYHESEVEELLKDHPELEEDKTQVVLTNEEED